MSRDSGGQGQNRTIYSKVSGVRGVRETPIYTETTSSHCTHKKHAPPSKQEREKWEGGL
jgi:hypothetical protein